MIVNRHAAALLIAILGLGCDQLQAPQSVLPADAGPPPACAPDGGLGLCALASGQDSPDGLVVTAMDVYWTNLGTSAGTGTVMAVPVGGGTATTIASGQTATGDLAIDPSGMNLYWTDLLGPNTSAMAGSVAMSPLAGGTPITLASGQNEPDAIALDAAHIYWTDLGTNANSYLDGVILQASLNGGSTLTLASAQNAPRFMTIDSNNVYWSCSSESASVVGVPIGGNAPVTIATGQNNPESLAIVDGMLYWINRGTKANQYQDGALVGARPGGTSTTILSQLADPYVMVSDSLNFYYATANGAIVAVPVGGGTPQAIAFGQGMVVNMAVDAESLYWADQSNGRVMKLTPK